MTALATLLAFGAAAACALAVGPASTAPILRRLPVPRATASVAPTDVLTRLGGTRVGRRLRRPGPDAALATSGWTITPERFAGLRLAAGGGGALLGLLVPGPGPLIAPLSGFVGLRLPLFVAARAGRRRRAAIDAEIPQLLDLLAAGSSAGLAAPLALRRATDGLQGPLAGELRRALDSVDLGARWREELRALADRLLLPDLTRTVAAVTRTESLGSSLAEATAELAATVRATRRAAVTERARTAPVKMLFPLVFLVLPAFLLLTVVPVLLTTVQSIR
jgi:tight adherence protein C